LVVCGGCSQNRLVLVVSTGPTGANADYANHTYTKLGTYIVTGVAMNGIGNTTINYVVVVQIPINPSDMIVSSTAPAIFPPGELYSACWNECHVQM